MSRRLSNLGNRMALLTARLTVIAAVALVAAAQVVVAPASCCLLRSALFGGEKCCAVVAEPTAPSCCHGPSGADEVPAFATHAPHSNGECLWCSAGPKTAASDRVVLSDADVTWTPLAVVEPVPAAPASASLKLVADEPFHRTAVGMCAWLCVWRK